MYVHLRAFGELDLDMKRILGAICSLSMEEKINGSLQVIITELEKYSRTNCLTLIDIVLPFSDFDLTLMRN